MRRACVHRVEGARRAKRQGIGKSHTEREEGFCAQRLSDATEWTGADIDEEIGSLGIGAGQKVDTAAEGLPLQSKGNF